MAELTQIVNGEYIGADKYTITDTSDGKKQIVFSPDSVLKQGTPVGAEILNEIQKNGLYYLVGTHRVNGQESIYDCTLVGIDTFEFTQLNVLFKPNIAPTQPTVKLNISGQVFTLTEQLINANQIGLLLVKSEMKAYTWGTKIAIVDDLTTGGADTALSARMGKYIFERLGGMNFIEGLTRLGLSYPCSLKDIVKKIPRYTVFFSYFSPEQYFTELKAFQVSNDLEQAGSIIIFRNIEARTFGITQGNVNNQLFISFNTDGTVLNIEYLLTNKSKLFLGNSGIAEVKYIQDAGTKTINLGYIDRDTGKLYRAKETNTDVAVTDKFEPADNINNSKNISEIGKTYATVNSSNTSSNKVSVLSQTKASTIFQVQVEGFYLCVGNAYVQEGSNFIYINKNGKNLTSNRGSTASINIYSYLTVGDKIEFTNTGDGFEFQYTIVKIG